MSVPANQRNWIVITHSEGAYLDAVQQLIQRMPLGRCDLICVPELWTTDFRSCLPSLELYLRQHTVTDGVMILGCGQRNVKGSGRPRVDHAALIKGCVSNLGRTVREAGLSGLSQIQAQWLYVEEPVLEPAGIAVYCGDWVHQGCVSQIFSDWGYDSLNMLHLVTSGGIEIEADDLLEMALQCRVLYQLQTRRVVIIVPSLCDAFGGASRQQIIRAQSLQTQFYHAGFETRVHVEMHAQVWSEDSLI